MKPNLLTAPVLKHPLGTDTSFKRSPRAEHFSKPAEAGDVRGAALPARNAGDFRSRDSGMKDTSMPAYRDFGINE
jgi:hypothetical protein